MRIPEDPTDRQLRKLIRRSARHVGLHPVIYAQWMRIDPDGAADELVLALHGNRDPERAKQKFTVAFKKSPADMDAFLEWKRANPAP